MKRLSGTYKLVMNDGTTIDIKSFKEQDGFVRVVVDHPSKAGKDFFIEDVGYIPMGNIKFISAGEIMIDETVTKDSNRLDEIKKELGNRGPSVFLSAATA